MNIYNIIYNNEFLRKIFFNIWKLDFFHFYLELVFLQTYNRYFFEIKENKLLIMSMIAIIFIIYKHKAMQQ